jgi:2-polyprenyl-3-methyl-5-hydroxy-6-metoxy-1,4-benzoquinol methylase
MDKSNGYENIAHQYIEVRGQTLNGMGASIVRSWAQTLPTGATVLDLGCGSGIPISKVLVEEGLSVYGIDASATMVNAFQHNFPMAPVACESAEDSLFFERTFDAIICWGLLFLLSKATQAKVIQKAADALQPGGRFLFTAPYQEISWEDVLTRQLSLSLGAENYTSLLSTSGLYLLEELEDEGENHYYHAIKI